MTMASYLYLTLTAFGIQRRKSIVTSSRPTVTQKIEDPSTVLLCTRNGQAFTLPCPFVRCSHAVTQNTWGGGGVYLLREERSAKMAPVLCTLLSKVRICHLHSCSRLPANSSFLLIFFQWLISGLALFLEARLNFSWNQILSPSSSTVTYHFQNLKFLSSERPHNFKIGAKT